MAVFAKRPKPGAGQGAVRRVGSLESLDDDDDAEVISGGSGSQRRKLLSLDADEDGEAFKVKKSKNSRLMAARAPLKPPKGEPRQPLRGGLKSSMSGSRVAETIPQGPEGDDDVMVVEEAAAVEASEVVPGELLEEHSEDDQDPAGQGAVAAARLARAQRAAARELYGAAEPGSPTRPPEYVPLVPQAPPKLSEVPSRLASNPHLAAVVAAANMELAQGAEKEPDAADAWERQQMKVGVHKRHGSLSSLGEEEEDPMAPPSRAQLVIDEVGVKRRGSDRAEEEAESRRRSRRGTGVAVAASDGLGKALLSPSEAMVRLWEALKTLESGAGELGQKTEELYAQKQDALDQIKEIERQGKVLDRQLRAVQDLEELAWSLGGLLDAKAGKVRQATQTLGQMEKDFAKKRARRRARAMAELLKSSGAALSGPTPEAEEDEEKDEKEENDEDDMDEESEVPVAKAAPRSRNAKRKARQKQQAVVAKGTEGWDTSSGSEADGHAELVSDRAAFCAAVHKQVMADVGESFDSTSAVLKPLRLAKERLRGEYSQAYVPLALPEALGFYIEHSLLWWDPLQLVHSAQGQGEDQEPVWGPQAAVLGTQLESFDWFDDLAKFTELMGEDDDPDRNLVPELVRKCVFPEVIRRIKECWDVTSLKQSARVASLMDECLLFEEEQSTTAFAGLLSAAMERLEDGLSLYAPEVFVASDVLSKWYSSPARYKMLWRSCKIAHCALQLDGRVSDAELLRFVLTRIYTARIAPHLKAPRLDAAELAVVEKFVAALPQRWLENGLPTILAPLRDALGPRAPTGPAAAATQEAAGRVLHRLRCFDEAQVLLAQRT